MTSTALFLAAHLSGATPPDPSFVPNLGGGSLASLVQVVPDAETNVWQMSAKYEGWGIAALTVTNGGVVGGTNVWCGANEATAHLVMTNGGTSLSGAVVVREPYPTTFLVATNFGARGDARQTWAACTNGGLVVGVADLSSADVGKQIQLVSMGPETTAPYHQGYIGRIVSVSGTNATLAWAVGNSSTGAVAVIGTDNHAALQAVSAAAGTNRARVYFPPGTYLATVDALTHETVTSDWVDDGAWNLTQGTKLHVVGDSRDTTAFLGVSAWRSHPSGWPWRGPMILLRSPFNLDDYLSFDGVTMNGGVVDIYAYGHGDPWGSPVTGGGWNFQTHHCAIINVPGGAAYAAWYPVFNIPVLRLRNCGFAKWFAEVTQGGCGGTAGNGIQQTNFMEVSSCVFSNAIGSCVNMMEDCLVRDSSFGLGCWPGEMYEDGLRDYGVSRWIGNEMFGDGGMSFTGSTLGKSHAAAHVVRNTFYNVGITLLGWKNFFATNNTFIGSGAQITQGFLGQQPSNGQQDANKNWWFVGNHFVANNTPFQFESANIPVDLVVISNNTHTVADANNPRYFITVPFWAYNGVGIGLVASNVTDGWLISDEAGANRTSYFRCVGNTAARSRQYDRYAWETADPTAIEYGFACDGSLVVTSEKVTPYAFSLYTAVPSLLWDGATVTVAAPDPLMNGYPYKKPFTFNGDLMTPPAVSVYRWSTNSLTWVKQ